MELKERKELAVFHLAGLVALAAGVFLELSQLCFSGLDFLIGALFVAATLLGALEVVTRSRAGWGFFTAGLGTLALTLHLLLSLERFF